MNYQQYLEIKKSCEKKMKLYSNVVLFATIFSLAQTAILFFHIDFHYIYVNLIFVDQLYTLGYQYINIGNIVLGSLFYFACGLVAILFVIGLMLDYSKTRFAYLYLLTVYIIDTILCVATFSVIQFLIHGIMIFFCILALRNRNYLRTLNKNVWGDYN